MMNGRGFWIGLGLGALSMVSLGSGGPPLQARRPTRSRVYRPEPWPTTFIA